MSRLLAEVHLSPVIAVPLLVVGAVAALAYWRRLARGSVPRIRRRLRRSGLLVGLVGGIAGVAATSFLDPEVRPGGYLAAWGTVALLLVPAVAIAAIDAIVTVRLHHRSLERRAARDAGRIRTAVEAAERQAGDAGDPTS